MRKVFTLAIVVQEGQVLLGRKLKKLGAGKWNGFGGKVEEGEEIEAAAKRECVEEVGIEPLAIRKAGVITFYYPDKPLGADEHEVHIFEVTKFAGQPQATDEMADPQWFAAADVPYGEMWEDDRYWLPMLLAGVYFEGRFEFDMEGRIVASRLEETQQSS